MSPSFTFVLTLAATVADGLLAGPSLDQSIKQLPARHKIGPVAYSAYQPTPATNRSRSGT
jgi:hypothetical protein